MLLDVLVPPSVYSANHVLSVGQHHTLYAVNKSLLVLFDTTVVCTQEFDTDIQYITLRDADTVMIGLLDGLKMFKIFENSLEPLRNDLELSAGDSVISCLDGNTLLYNGTYMRIQRADGRIIHLPTRVKGVTATLFYNFSHQLCCIISEQCGLHSVYNIENDSIDCIWSVFLPEGSLVIPLTGLHHIEQERMQILQSFQYCLLFYNSDGTIVFFGIQESIMDGAIIRKGEPIFSYSILEKPRSAVEMFIMPNSERFTIKMIFANPSSNLFVEPFSPANTKTCTILGVVEEQSVEELPPVVSLTKDHLLCIKSGEPVKAVKCIGDLKTCSRLYSAFEISDHFAVKKDALLLSDSLEEERREGLIQTFNNRIWRLNMNEESISIGIQKDNHICVPESLLNTITDAQIIDNIVFSLTRITESGIVHEIRNRNDLYILSTKKCDGAIAALVDAFTGIYRFSGETLEIAALNEYPQHMHEPCKIFSCLSFKLFTLRDNLRAILVNRKESLDLLVKRFVGDKIVWERMVKLKHVCRVDDYTMDQCAIYVMCHGGIFAHKYRLEFSTPPGYQFSSVCLGAFDNLTNGPLHDSYSSLKHLKSGYDDGFKSLLIFSLVSRHNVPLDLMRFSWLQAFMSDCQDQLTTHILKECESKPEWTTISKYGFPLWLKSDAKFSELIESVCKLMAKNLSSSIDLLSIFYACLGKEKTTIALWKASRHPDSEKIVSFLQTAQSPDRRAVAEKTAYALIAKQREHLAVFFMLMAGLYMDAMAIAVDRLCDLNLAIIISRLTSTEFKWEKLSRIESFLVSSIEKIDNYDWSILLKEDPTNGDDWTLPMACIKRMITKIHAMEYTIRDIRGLWKDGLYKESQTIIDMIPDENIKCQLYYDAETLKSTISI